MKRFLHYIEHWRDSIAARLLVKVFAFYIIITVVVTVVHMYTEFTVTKKDVNLDLSVFQSSFEPGISLAIWNQDDAALVSELHAVYGVAQIVGAKVLDDEGSFVAGIGHMIGTSARGEYFNPETLAPMAGGEATPIGMFQNEKAIYYRDEETAYKVGTLFLYSSDDFVLSQVLSEYAFIVINAIIKTLALWLIVIWQSKPVISRPIEEFSKKLGAQNLDNALSSNKCNSVMQPVNLLAAP